MKTIKGPAVFLAQFMGAEAPFNTLDGICAYMAELGYKGVQIPTWEAALIDLDLAASSKDYCDELKGRISAHGLEITELSTHLQGQLIASHSAYDQLFDGFAPQEVRGKPAARQQWATEQVKQAIRASGHLGLSAHATFSGALLWPYVYPWPQRPAGLVETGFAELAERWLPLLELCDEVGVDMCYELHPGEDLHDGVTFERFVEEVDGHHRACILYDPSHFVLQCMDYLQFIDIYHERIQAFHVKDAEFELSGRAGVYGSYDGWQDRPGRFRSLGDGQVDFGGIFTRLTKYGFDGWAVMEWECAFKSSRQGAAEGAPFIAQHIIEATDKAFDDFADSGVDEAANRAILGLDA